MPGLSSRKRAFIRLPCLYILPLRRCYYYPFSLSCSLQRIPRKRFEPDGCISETETSALYVAAEFEQRFFFDPRNVRARDPEFFRDLVLRISPVPTYAVT